jgi:glycogen synthase
MNFAMRQDFSWRRTAEEIVDVYRHTLDKTN